MCVIIIKLGHNFIFMYIYGSIFNTNSSISICCKCLNCQRGVFQLFYKAKLVILLQCKLKSLRSTRALRHFRVISVCFGQCQGKLLYVYTKCDDSFRTYPNNHRMKKIFQEQRTAISRTKKCRRYFEIKIIPQRKHIISQQE